MPNNFDAYREALVMEEQTIWPEEYETWEWEERARVERTLHESPQEAADLDYVRTHTGFCRVITVTPADVERVQV